MLVLKNPKIAVPVVLFAGLIWSFGPLVVRYMDNPHLIPWQYIFGRGLTIFILLNLYLFFEEGKDFYKNYFKIGISGLVGGSGLGVAMISFMFSITNTSAAITLLCLAAMPFFTALLAFLFLKEKLKKRRVIALLVGFLGTLVVLRPDISINLGGILILISALIWSVSLIFIKKLTETDSAVTISLYAGVGMIPPTFVAAYPYLTMPNISQFLIIFFIAISGTLAQTLLNSAFKRGQLAVLLPLDFLKLVWSILIGYTIFIESTPYSLWLGGLLIVGSSSYIAWRERN